MDLSRLGDESRTEGREHELSNITGKRMPGRNNATLVLDRCAGSF